MLGLVLVFLAIAISAWPTSAPADVPASTTTTKATTQPMFEITGGRRPRPVRMSGDQHRAVLTLSGNIDHAKVVRRADSWPDELVIRFPLPWMENLSIECGDLKFEGSIDHTTGNQLRYSIENTVLKINLPVDGPATRPVRFVNLDGSYADAPMEEGYFEFVLPAGVIQQDSNQLNMSWIDVYRN
jgi:hypothetical protein